MAGGVRVFVGGREWGLVRRRPLHSLQLLCSSRSNNWDAYASEAATGTLCLALLNMVS
jgi:hypothetical protein